MATLERAIEIAANAHAGQLDQGGQPYILHPLRVMLLLESEEERIVGVLHDVIEDTPVTLAQLQAEGFSERVVCALDALTKQPGESRMDAAARAAADAIALRVKLSDNADNLDLSRIPNPTHKDLARMEEYRHVREFLIASAGDALRDRGEVSRAN